MVNIRVIHGHDFLRSNLDGQIDLSKSRRVLRDLIRANTATRYNLLIDMRQSEETLTFPEVQKLVEELGKHAPLFHGRIALLDRWDVGFEKTQFFEASATTKGFAVRAFLDFEHAAEWVCQGSFGPPPSPQEDEAPPP